ncbi:MAG TPA: citrate synthase family protein [Gaiellales bacterium]
MREDEYLSAEQAAAYLGVSRRTLYAYVSRGRIVSEPDYRSGRRAHRYPRAMLVAFHEGRERRRDTALKALGALSAGAPVLESKLTLIADGRLWYRGRDACELSRTSTFEAVASLLWTGTSEHGAYFPSSPSQEAAAREGSIADRLFARLVEARSEPAVTISNASAATLRASARTARALFDAAGALGSGRLAERLARGWGAADAGLIDAALILCADHELNASSFTARCVAATDAPMHDVLLAALCALEGRRHGGISNRVEALLRDAERDGSRRAFDRALEAEGWPPGFGDFQGFYPDGDPRARELLGRLAPPPASPAAELCALAEAELGVHPTIDFALGAVARAASLPDGSAFGLFALGRSAGWIAHALEAAADGTLIRPRARYTGPPPDTAR